jgi:parvulin-like peptidyl-prolyl isomerase
MKALNFFVFLCVSVGWAQSAAPQAAPTPAEKGDTVVAIFDDGKTMTAAEYQTLLHTNPNWQGQEQEKVLMKYAQIRKAAGMAKDQNLEQKSPYKESLDFAILVALADIEANYAMSSINVGPAEIEKYYNEHKEPYKTIKVSGIKVAFGAAAAPAESNSSTVMASRAPKKALTQEEAKAKAEKLVAEIRAGADFSKLVILDSDDEASKAKGGDLGTWRMTDNVPDSLRVAVLSLKEGEVSEPVLQSGGYYVIHADAITYTPLADVRDSIFAQLKQQHAQEWLQNLDRNTKVVFPPKEQPAPSSPAK